MKSGRGEDKKSCQQGVLVNPPLASRSAVHNQSSPGTFYARSGTWPRIGMGYAFTCNQAIQRLL